MLGDVRQNFALILVIFAAAILLVICSVFARYGKLYLMATMSGASISMLDLLGMTFRKVNPKVIVQAKVEAVQAGLEVDDHARNAEVIGTKSLEAHHLAGGNVTNVVRAMIMADQASVKLGFLEATEIDLSGRDVLEETRKRIGS